ncbi:HNH endonuclease [Citrobacter cronae]|uniref:HNH endonuclease n=1 Tax=Citrobacter cronae TaxID=1748967 RepID=UPI001C11311A|nr:HNH endonuclease [Citrobacter cronae]MBU5384806.1 HNH endonuclease [Citrobacter cronae]
MKFNIRSYTVEMDETDALNFVGYPIHISSNGYPKVTGWHFGKERYLHRIIMNAGPFDVVDHIDGNKLNCSRSNLRICTQADNAKNVRLRNDNSSGIPGVYWVASRHKWAAQISVNGKTVGLGRFDEISDAIEARRKAEDFYYGDFAASKGGLCEKARQ